jgi:NAD(P)-dependent dehydrogenase (short-subunit alcohol dehydrogenase family)
MPLVLVTGATDGIGRQTAIDLALRGATVLLHGRNAAKLEAVAAEVEARREGAVAGVFRADLAKLGEVRAMAEAIATAHPRLDVLLANAGIFMTERALTEDGFETTFAVNHLAHVLLTHLLLPAVKASDDGRIIHVSSQAHSRGNIDWDNLQQEKRFNGNGAYGLSKLANILFTVELAKRLGPSPVAHALHPGVVTTTLLRTGWGGGGPDSHEEGARTSVLLALDPIARASTGTYWVRGRPAQPSSVAQDAAATKRLYEESCKMVGVAPLPAR